MKTPRPSIRLLAVACMAALWGPPALMAQSKMSSGNWREVLVSPNWREVLVSPYSAPAQPAGVQDQGLTLENFAHMVARSDELVRAQALEESIAGQGLRGAMAVYEPFLTTSINREGKLVPTSAEESFSRGGVASDQTSPVPYEAYVTQLKPAIVIKGPTGADWEFSYNLDAIVNSLQAKLGSNYISPEYRGSLGFSVTQPLMRNAGREVTESGIRIADREEAIARETVRQVLSQRINEGLQTYLFVQRAQDRVRWRQRALDLTRQLEAEISRQFQAGLKSQHELTESRAALALRQAQLAQAQQELEEQINALQVFLSAHQPQDQRPMASRWLPADTLKMPTAEFADSLRMTDAQTAYERRPETRVNRLRIEREEVKRAVAKNQTEPELNFRLRYGKESLMDRPMALQDYYFSSSSRYNTWGIGLNLRVGLGGDAKKDSEYQSAVLRKTQAELSLGAAQQRIANELLGVKAVLERTVQQAARQADIVKAQQDLLAVERRMMAEGQKSLLDVLRREIDITQTQEAWSDALTQVNRTSFVASQVNGGLLSRLGLE